MSKKIRFKWILSGLTAGVLIGLLGLLLWHYYPEAEALLRPERMEAFVKWLHGFGILSLGVLWGIQVLQVISGIIPALPIQLAAGMTYGPVVATIVCLAGIAVGSSLVFLAVKRWGRPLAERILPGHKLDKLAFLQDAQRLKLIVFILYFIPAMPKDVFTYLAGLTPLSLKEYLSITLVARAPSIFCVTFASRAVFAGEYTSAIVIFCVTGFLGICGMLFRKRILGWLERRFGKK